QGLSLTGPDELLKQLTKTVLETALNEEMTEHLGYEKHDPPGAGTGVIDILTPVSVKQRWPCRCREGPGALLVPWLVVDQAPPEAAEEFVREVTECSVVVVPGRSWFVVGGTGAYCFGP